MRRNDFALSVALLLPLLLGGGAIPPAHAEEGQRAPQMTEEDRQIAEMHRHEEAAPPLTVQFFYLSHCIYCSNVVRVLNTELSEYYGNRVLVFMLDMANEQVSRNMERLKAERGISGDVQMLVLIGDRMLQGTNEILAKTRGVVEEELKRLEALAATEPAAERSLEAGKPAVVAETERPPSTAAATADPAWKGVSVQTMLIVVLGFVVLALLFLVVRLSSRVAQMAEALQQSAPGTSAASPPPSEESE